MKIKNTLKDKLIAGAFVLSTIFAQPVYAENETLLNELEVRAKTALDFLIKKLEKTKKGEGNYEFGELGRLTVGDKTLVYFPEDNSCNLENYPVNKSLALLFCEEHVHTDYDCDGTSDLWYNNKKISQEAYCTHLEQMVIDYNFSFNNNSSLNTAYMLKKLILSNPDFSKKPQSIRQECDEYKLYFDKTSFLCAVSTLDAYGNIYIDSEIDGIADWTYENGKIKPANSNDQSKYELFVEEMYNSRIKK